MSSPEGADRPALLAIEHPLSYTKAPFVGLKPKTDEERVKYLYEHKLIEDLMHEYSYSIDACAVKPPNFQRLNDCFTEDCEVIYHQGPMTFKHSGREGFAEWVVGMTQQFFGRSLHLASTQTIKFESDTVAYARASAFTTNGFHNKPLDNFFCGGHYYWSFRKVDDEWKVSYLCEDIVWGDGKVPSAQE